MSIKSTLAAVAVCAGLLVAGGAGGAMADELITGRDIADNTVTSRDVQDRGIKRKDINFHFAGKYRTERGLAHVHGRVDGLRSRLITVEADLSSAEHQHRLLVQRVLDLEAAVRTLEQADDDEPPAPE